MLLIATEKPSADSRLGISLDRTPEGRVVVSRVSRTGLFAGTGLTTGMEIVMVNDVLCDGLGQVSRAMQQAPPGRLAVHVIAPADEEAPAVVAAAAAHPKPPRHNSNTNTTTTRTTSSRIQEDMDPGAVEILLDQERRAPPPPPPPPARVLRKRSSNSFHKKKNTLTILVPHAPKLGLRLQQDNHHVIVRQINPTSVFADTELRPGMRIISMNDYDCVGCDVEEISQLFRREPREDGVLTLVVQERSGSSFRRSKGSSESSVQENRQERALEETGENDNNPGVPSDLSERFQRYKSARSTQQEQQPQPKKKSSSTSSASSSLIRASILKSTPAESTGVRLKESPDRRHVRIDRIQPDSPFGRTSLRVGMTVRRVNGIDCSGLSVQQVAQLVRETQGKLTIEASPAREAQPSRRA